MQSTTTPVSVSASSMTPLFHLRLLAVLPFKHFLQNPRLTYPLFVFYYIPGSIVTPVTFPFAYAEHDELKAELLKV